MIPLAKQLAEKHYAGQYLDFVSFPQANLAQGNLLLGLSFPANVSASALEAPNAQFQSILKVLDGSVLALSRPQHTVDVFWPQQSTNSYEHTTIMTPKDG